MERYKLKFEKYGQKDASAVFLTTAEEKVAMEWAISHIEQSTQKGYWTLFVWLPESNVWFDIMCDNS